MKRLHLYFLFFIVSVSSSCHRDAEPILFGTDVCAECRMTIVDSRFGAELITEKGKVFKFDSGECMIQYVRKNKIEENRAQALLVIDHSKPGVLVSVVEARFLHSEKIPSPMGEFLSAYGSKDSLIRYQNLFSGESWTWEEVCEHIK